MPPVVGRVEPFLFSTVLFIFWLPVRSVVAPVPASFSLCVALIITVMGSQVLYPLGVDVSTNVYVPASKPTILNSPVPLAENISSPASSPFTGRYASNSASFINLTSFSPLYSLNPAPAKGSPFSLTFVLSTSYVNTHTKSSGVFPRLPSPPTFGLLEYSKDTGKANELSLKNAIEYAVRFAANR